MRAKRPQPEHRHFGVSRRSAGAGSRGPRRQDIEATPEAAVQLNQLDLTAASGRLETRLLYGLQCRARSATSAAPGEVIEAVARLDRVTQG